MALLVHNLALGLDEGEDLLVAKAAKKLRLAAERIGSVRIVRKSLDARPRHMRWIYSIAVDVAAKQREVLRRCSGGDVQEFKHPARPRVLRGQEPMAGPPVIVGAGPAGLFAAVLLAEAGYQPLVLDRGQPVEQRDQDVRKFVTDRTLDPESNFVFGEGGAGTYSDGKLYSRTHDPLGGWILEQFVAFGADPLVAISGKPHVGSDELPDICRRMREYIESLGGEVRYGTRVDGLEMADAKVRAITLGDGERIGAGCLLPAIGHSARDTYKMLAAAGVPLAARPFQMGLRIEHPQGLIDRAQLGAFAGREDIGPADYHLVARGAAGGGRDVYTFCMCPGGRVLPTNHQTGTICTNGGSAARRDSGWASAAVVMSVAAEQFGDDPLEGLAMQERIERECFAAAGGDYSPGAQRVEDFLAGRASDGELKTSSLIDAAPVDFNRLLPDFLVGGLHAGMADFAKRIEGFAGGEAMFLGPETRASCPVRIVRDRESRVSPAADNLYPIGEGAGYAGGIVSAAVDGLRSAEAVIGRYAPAR